EADCSVAASCSRRRSSAYAGGTRLGAVSVIGSGSVERSAGATRGKIDGGRRPRQCDAATTGGRPAPFTAELLRDRDAENPCSPAFVCRYFAMDAVRRIRSPFHSRFRSIAMSDSSPTTPIPLYATAIQEVTRSNDQTRMREMEAKAAQHL